MDGSHVPPLALLYGTCLLLKMPNCCPYKSDSDSATEFDVCYFSVWSFRVEYGRLNNHNPTPAGAPDWHHWRHFNAPKHISKLPTESFKDSLLLKEET
jgi:hypothetical protein